VIYFAIETHRPKQKDMDMIIFRKLNLKKILKKRKNTDGSDPRDVRSVKEPGYGGMGM